MMMTYYPFCTQSSDLFLRQVGLYTMYLSAFAQQHLGSDHRDSNLLVATSRWSVVVRQCLALGLLDGIELKTNK